MSTFCFGSIPGTPKEFIFLPFKTTCSLMEKKDYRMISLFLFFFFCKPWTFYFVLGCSQLTKLWQFQVNREGTQPYICMNPFSPNLSSIQASTKHWVEFHVLSSRSLLVIHFKYSSVHVTFPNSLSLSPYSSFLKASTPTLRMMLRPWEKTQVHPRKSLPLLSTCQSNN